MWESSGLENGLTIIQSSEVTIISDKEHMTLEVSWKELYMLLPSKLLDALNVCLRDIDSQPLHNICRLKKLKKKKGT